MSLLLLPDLMLLLLAAACLILGLSRQQSRRALVLPVAATGLLATALLLLALPYDQEYTLFGTYRVTGLALLYKLVFVLAALFTVLLARPYFLPGGNVRGQMGDMGEFCAILIICTLGMGTVVCATDLLTLFIGMELATIPLYVMSAFLKGDEKTAEASTKFIIMGSLSTGLMLFGYSFLYGAAGGLRFEQILSVAQANPANPLLLIGVLFILAATGFKLTLVPFHMWAPDVYEGAPTPVTAFLAIGSKAAAIAFLQVLLFGPLAPLHQELQFVLLLLAGATMTVGNLGALRQHNLRRFMAYSSIAQAGYIVMAMAGDHLLAGQAIIFYLLVYTAANFATFFIISIIGKDNEEEFPALRGMGKHHPGLAAILMLAMFSLAGIPPLAGFTGKFMLFAATASEGYYFMVVFAALNSTVSLYYYLLLIKEAYITAPDNTDSYQPLIISRLQRASLGLLALGMILPALLPQFSTAIQQIVR